MLGDLADVQQAVGAGEDFNERAELDQPDHLAEVGLSEFRHSRQIADHLNGSVGGDFITRSNVDLTVVFDVNLHAGLLDDGANHLASGSDDVSNLIGRNLHGVDARRVRRNGGARFGQGGEHLL